MTLTDTHCQGGCGKIRSILYGNDPAQWLCNDCRTNRQEWLVKVQLVRNGAVIAENIYEYENEYDAHESAFKACQEALNDSTEQHSADIQGAEDEMERARR